MKPTILIYDFVEDVEDVEGFKETKNTATST